MLSVMERRTQAARSAATRERLLDATIECLVDLGWSGTSTTEVVRRAGVSRGAQVHHYPTKEDLVLAAVEHLVDRRVDEYRAAFDQMAPGERTVGAAFDLLWSTYQGDTSAAWIEFAVAARTDPALHARFTELARHVQRTTLDIFIGMFPETDADREFARVGLAFAFSMLDGMALARLSGAEPHQLDEVREIFNLVTAPYFPLSALQASIPEEGAPE